MRAQFGAARVRPDGSSTFVATGVVFVDAGRELYLLPGRAAGSS
jgi:hypothetical protein